MYWDEYSESPHPQYSRTPQSSRTSLSGIRTNAYQIYTEQADVGKTIRSSKKRVMWTFALDDQQHRIVLTHSVVTGKKQIEADGQVVHESQKVIGSDFQYGFRLANHHIRVMSSESIDKGFVYDLQIDQIPFRELPTQAEILLSKKDKPRVQTLEGFLSGKETDAESKPKKHGTRAKPKKEKTKKSSPKEVDLVSFSDPPNPQPTAGPTHFDPFETSTIPQFDPLNKPAQVVSGVNFDPFDDSPDISNISAQLADLQFETPIFEPFQSAAKQDPEEIKKEEREEREREKEKQDAWLAVGSLVNLDHLSDERSIKSTPVKKTIGSNTKSSPIGTPAKTSTPPMNYFASLSPQTPMQTMPMQTTPMQTMPMQTTPIQTMPMHFQRPPTQTHLHNQPNSIAFDPFAGL